MAAEDLTCERLRELFDYDVETGLFTRKACADVSKIGQTPTALDDWGYVRFRVAGRKYRAHRLAWLYVFGEWPQFQLDHKDGDKLNNRIGNLRDVPQPLNQHNRKLARADSATGVLGVHVGDDGRFIAQIGLDGKRIRVGVFDDPEAAGAAYLAAKKRMHEGFLA